jgi:hypothetical protein
MLKVVKFCNYEILFTSYVDGYKFKICKFYNYPVLTFKLLKLRWLLPMKPRLTKLLNLFIPYKTEDPNPSKIYKLFS